MPLPPAIVPSVKLESLRAGVNKASLRSNGISRDSRNVPKQELADFPAIPASLIRGGNETGKKTGKWFVLFAP